MLGFVLEALCVLGQGTRGEVELRTPITEAAFGCWSGPRSQTGLGSET